ncbi:MAG: DUF6125 family protein [Candidatus Kariarchaeaceae archaeon]|jgi:hypothetical protein
MENLSKQEVKELLNKNWMTHDAMWFKMCLNAIGIEKTNLINKKATNEMAKIEARRIKKLLGIEEIQSTNELKSFFENGLDLLKADFMQFKGEFDDGKLIWTAKNCFAHDGIQRLGVIDKYECGIFERIHGWFDELHIDYNFEPTSVGCLMYENGNCFRTYSFKFEFVI